MPIPLWRPQPAPPAALREKPLPYPKANPLSRALYHWMGPFLRIGYSRPLEVNDLWTLPEELQCVSTADAIEKHLNARLPPARRLAKYQPKAELGEKSHHGAKASQELRGIPRNEYEDMLDEGDQQDAEIRAEVADDLSLGIMNSRSDRRGSEATVFSVSGNVTSKTRHAKEHHDIPDPQIAKTLGKRKARMIAKGKYTVQDGAFYDMSLWRSMFLAKRRPWFFCLLLLAGDYGLRVGGPLISRQLIKQISLSNIFSKAQSNGSSTTDLEQPAALYHVAGLALALSFLTLTNMLLNTHWLVQCNMIGALIRSSAIDLVGRKAMRLSGKARCTYNNGRMNTAVTNDTGYLENAPACTTALIVLPVTTIAGIGLLIWLLGYSALVGVGLLVLCTPGVGRMFQIICRCRQKQAKLLDHRVRVMSEIVNNIRAVKLYAYEDHLGKKVAALRKQEVVSLQEYAVLRATINALFTFVPVIAIVLTFITYAKLGNELAPSTIFPALQFFDIVASSLRVMPLMLSNLLDARIGLERVNSLLVAEELESELHIDPELPYGLRVKGDFQYDSVSAAANEKPEDASPQESGTKTAPSGVVAKVKSLFNPKQAVAPAPDVVAEKEETAVPFALRGIDLSIPRGALVCIVGRVGSGKTALLMGLINEMRQLEGDVCFGGKVSLVPQHAWVQSGTVRDNITFSTDAMIDQQKIKDVIDATGLQPDIDMWEDAELTQIGERGITLSGGQRQRICIARAAYDESDIVLLDDPLSAVDANVGHHLLHNCILNGPFAQRTRILVTHQLDVLPMADLVIVMDRDDKNEGRIVQQGTFQELQEQDGVFRTLIEDYGAAGQSHASPAEAVDNEVEKETTASEENKAVDEEKQKGGKLLLDEDKAVGEVSWKTYLDYLKAIGPVWWGIYILLSVVCVEASRVTNSLFLGFWSQNKISGFTQGAYMGIYAGLAGAIAIATWVCIYMMTIASYRAAFLMFNDAWLRVMRSPTSWHDRTPTGRIISRMSKDIQNLDSRLANAWNSYLLCIASGFGTFFVVVWSFPWLGLAFIPVLAYLWLTASYYRRSTRETKRNESLLRSFMYSSLQEQLGGLAVIRAFGQQARFARNLQKSIDEVNRAWFTMNFLGGWLEIRLNIISNVLVFGVCLCGAFFRNTINAAQFGVVLTFVMASLGTLGQLVPFWTTCEQQMLSVERIQHYRELETEAASHLPNDPKPDDQWPTAGAVSFENVQLQYRPDLPLVLKGLTFKINPGEKVGIIGRTGAGKSSIAQALFRTVELSNGKIEVDGKDLSRLGLEVVRSRLAIIPQDAFLFGGTVRENIDPTGVRSDAELHDAMSFLHRSSSSSTALREKFQLDGTVANDGSNFSAGERQLLSLMRALSRKCKVLLLDEATSSVDPETDALIQKIIQTEFSDVTLISIAHRLQTVAFYDRILVMDAGRIAEFDTPLNLFDRPDSIFRSLCQKKAMGREDLVRIQTEASAAVRSAYPTPLPSTTPSLKSQQ